MWWRGPRSRPRRTLVAPGVRTPQGNQMFFVEPGQPPVAVAPDGAWSNHGDVEARLTDLSDRLTRLEERLDQLAQLLERGQRD